MGEIRKEHKTIQLNGKKIDVVEFKGKPQFNGVEEIAKDAVARIRKKHATKSV